MRPLTTRCCSRARMWRRSPTGRSRPTCSTTSPIKNSRRAQALRQAATRRPLAQQEELTNVFGKLTWDAVPWSQPIPLVAGGVVIVAVLAVILWVIVKGYLPYLGKKWLTSVDQKRIAP